MHILQCLSDEQVIIQANHEKKIVICYRNEFYSETADLVCLHGGDYEVGLDAAARPGGLQRLAERGGGCVVRRAEKLNSGRHSSQNIGTL